MTPDILDGTVYSIAKVGNQVIVGGQFTQVQNANTSTTLTRVGVLAFNATTGQVSTTFAPNPLGTVYKVLPAADGQSVYVAGSFTSAGGQSTPGRIFKINVSHRRHRPDASWRRPSAATSATSSWSATTCSSPAR